MAEEFTVGPPAPVEDSRQLPAVDADGEAGIVTGVALTDHPDNEFDEVDDEDVDPTDAELDALVADVAVDDVDESGFGPDPSDFVGLDGGRGGNG